MMVLVLQLMTTGLFGPRMVCTDADGTQNLEWAALSCCTLDSGGSPKVADHCPGCGGSEGCDQDRNVPTDQAQLSDGGCGCVDVPAADDSVVRLDDSKRLHDVLATHVFVAVLTVVAILPDFTTDFRPLAFLPTCHAPPREHIATVILRI